jgi:hypothetical protein
MALREFKKDRSLQQVKLSLKQLNPEQVEVEVCLVKPPEKPDGLEVEMDEMWRSYFGKKDNPRWLW